MLKVQNKIPGYRRYVSENYKDRWMPDFIFYETMFLILFLFSPLVGIGNWTSNLEQSRCSTRELHPVRQVSPSFRKQ